MGIRNRSRRSVYGALVTGTRVGGATTLTILTRSINSAGTGASAVATTGFICGTGISV